MSSQPSASGLRIGSVGGAPIRIGASWLVLAALIIATVGSNLQYSATAPGPLGYLVAAAYALVLLASVLVHEGAHALTAQRCGFQVKAVVATLWGGHTSFEGRGMRPGSSALIAAAGPVANLLIGVVAYAVYAQLPDGIARLILFAAALSNLGLAAFNLLPGLPLDGGQLLEALIWRLTGTRRTGTLIAAWFGRVVAVGVVLWFVVVPLARGQVIDTWTFWSLLIAWVLWRGASHAITRSRVLGRLEGRTVDDVLHPLPVLASTAPVSEAYGLSIVVEDQRPVGLVSTPAIEAVPLDRRATTPVSAVLQREPDTWVIDAVGEDLLPVVQDLAHRRLPYAVVRRDGRVLGLLQGGDVQRLLEH